MTRNRLPTFGVDTVQRKSALEQNDVYTLGEYQDHIKKKYGKAVNTVGDKDRGCVSPLAGLATPSNRGRK
jgi:hypothetical protein